ncbi:MAG: type II toxin-antitoxin system VapC family toxin [Terriglobales bacterium]
MNKFLLDTNVVSEFRRTRPHGAVIAWLEAQLSAQLFISAVTIGEIQAGAARTRRRDPAKAQEIEDWLARLPSLYQVLPMDILCFREWGRLMDRKSAALVEDAMIAATARVHDLMVATRNERDFAQLDVRIFNPFKVS